MVSSESASPYADRLAFTPASARQRAVAAACAVACAAAVVAVAPHAAVRASTIPAFLPAVGALAVFGLALTAQILGAQFLASRFPPLGYLALAYGVEAVLATGSVATFPNTFAPDPTGSHAQTTTWLYIAWHWGFFALVAAYAISSIRMTRPGERRRTARGGLRLAALAALAAVVAILIVTLGFGDRLPVLVDRGHYVPNVWRRIYVPTTFFFDVALILTFLRARRLHSIVDVWIGITLLALLCEQTVASLGGGRYSMGWYVARAEWLVASLAFAFVLLYQMSKVLAGLTIDNRSLATASYTDALTGLLNRRAFDARIDAGIAQCDQRDEPYALLVIDVDEFKQFNDAFGHPRGDAALVAVGAALAAATAGDSGERFAARIGGEEFVIALPATGRLGAFVVAESVRFAVAALAIAQYDGCPTGTLTVSIGVATTEDVADGRELELLARADLALYAAKRAGRNRTHVAASNALELPFEVA